jgi:serine/threonine protein kinase
MTRTLCGTPDYLAPEAVTRQGHNHMVDCWGLGVLVYEMITQCSPFADPQGGNQMAVFRRIMHGPDALDWSLFVGKYESALLHEMRNGGALVEWINRDYTNTRDMLHCLWAVNPNQRMTCSKLKEHPYFPAEMSWADLREKKVPAPWVPELTSPRDTRYFDVEDFHHVRESGNAYVGPTDWFEEFGEDPDFVVNNTAATVDNNNSNGGGASGGGNGGVDSDATMAGDVDVRVSE